MTDWKARCAELTEALCGYTLSQDDCLLVDRQNPARRLPLGSLPDRGRQDAPKTPGLLHMDPGMHAGAGALWRMGGHRDRRC